MVEVGMEIGVLEVIMLRHVLPWIVLPVQVGCV